jgi:ATP adenylyltransferase
MLQAPWRSEYLLNVAENDRKEAAGHKPATGCFIRDYWLTPQDDLANHVIVRTEAGMIFLNAFPYTNGHLLVALGESQSRLLEYTPAQRAALWELTDLAVDLCERTLLPQGVNVGLNQGRAAGAGVPQHVHVHVVPRWNGDTNFMTAVGRVRVIPMSLEKMAERYRAVAQARNR